MVRVESDEEQRERERERERQIFGFVFEVLDPAGGGAPAGSGGRRRSIRVLKWTRNCFYGGKL